MDYGNWLRDPRYWPTYDETVRLMRPDFLPTDGGTAVPSAGLDGNRVGIVPHGRPTNESWRAGSDDGLVLTYSVAEVKSIYRRSRKRGADGDAAVKRFKATLRERETDRLARERAIAGNIGYID